MFAKVTVLAKKKRRRRYFGCCPQNSSSLQDPWKWVSYQNNTLPLIVPKGFNFFLHLHGNIHTWSCFCLFILPLQQIMIGMILIVLPIGVQKQSMQHLWNVTTSSFDWSRKVLLKLIVFWHCTCSAHWGPCCGRTTLSQNWANIVNSSRKTGQRQ